MMTVSIAFTYWVGLKHIQLPRPLSKMASVIADIENRFDVESGKRWLRDNIHVAVLICVVYVVAISLGRSAMANRRPYNLRRPLLMWNVGLAAFSLFGMVSLVPSLLHSVYHYGFIHSCCKSNYMTDPRLSLWSVLFRLSKSVELGDTMFIVLRKSPLQFLHWYHHITVLLYCWYGVDSSVGHWFGTMNYTIHTIMYTYYALKVIGVKVPSVLARTLTALQLSQMFVGILVSSVALRAKSGDYGIECNVSYRVLYLGQAIYVSYFALFAHFYYNRYCHSKKD